MKSEVQTRQHQKHKEGRHTNDQRNSTHYCILQITRCVITCNWTYMQYMGALNSVIVIYLVHKQQNVITTPSNINTITKVYQITLYF